MKEILISVLRNKNITIQEFRSTAENLSHLLAAEAYDYLPKKNILIQTPINKTSGVKLKNNIVIIPILRSAIAMLPAFLKYFQDAKVGFVGLRRDEKTAIANLYYKNLPKISKTDDIIIIDPMIATGGSGKDTIKLLIDLGIKEEKIIFSAIIASTEGLKTINKIYPKVKIFCAQVDKKLNPKKFIDPGLGDFGDRFFGTL